MNFRFLPRFIAAAALAFAVNQQGWAYNPIPADPSVRIGKLDNGLTYYIKHNGTPSGQADFFIAQRVGSINELDNQQGLAHFLEHMCFNGTEHFKGNSLITYLESIGVKFGKNLNAYTSTDETIYNICQVPTARTSALDSCVMILSDWSGRLLLNKEDIDSERGVIMGEMRQRSTPGSRILTRLAPAIYQGTIYGKRMPIGTADIVQNFKPKALRDYYEKWYHPANQAVIIVGDVDVDAMEQMVRKHFADLKAGKKSAMAQRVEIPDNSSPIAVTGSDPEQSVNMIQIYIKEPQLAKDEEGTIMELRRNYIRRLVASMMVERMEDLESNPDCPWSNLGIGVNKFLLSNTRNAFLMRANANDAASARKTLDILNTELLRASLHGFTETEFRRAQLSDRGDMNKAMANASVETNTELARKYATHFTRGGIIPSTEQMYKMMKGVERTTKLEDVNAYVTSLIGTDGHNRITSIYATPADSAGLAPEIILKDAANINLASIEPYVDKFSNRELLSETPVAGTVTSDIAGPFGSRLITLSNGIKVYLRPSDAKPTEVIIHGVSHGGFAMNYDPAKKATYKMTNDILAISGFGGHTASDLRKMLAGSDVRSEVKLNNTSEELIASTTPEDITKALQLLYLKATSVTKDDNAFGALMATNRSKLENPNRTATFAMGDTIHAIVYNRHPLGAKLTASDIDKVNYDTIVALHNDRFRDMSDFTYIITGNFNPDSIMNDVLTYIGSLPGNGRKEHPTSIGYGFYNGEGKYSYTHPMTDNPQSITYSFYNGECPYDLEHILLAQTFGSILKSRLLTEVREKRGLTYSINSHCSVTAGFDGLDTPSKFIMPVYIKSKPGHEEEVYSVVRATVADLIANGPTTDELASVKSFLSKNIGENRRDNSYWDTVLKVYDLYGPDMDSDYEKIVSGMTPEKIRNFGDKYIKNSNHVEISMLPE